MYASTCCSPNSLATWTNATNSQFSSFIWVSLTLFLSCRWLIFGLWRIQSAPFLILFLLCFSEFSFCYVLGWRLWYVGVRVWVGWFRLERSAAKLRVPIFFLSLFLCASSELYCVFIYFNKSSLFIPGWTGKNSFCSLRLPNAKVCASCFSSFTFCFIPLVFPPFIHKYCHYAVYIIANELIYASISYVCM